MPNEMPESMRVDIINRFNEAFNIKCKCDGCDERDALINELATALEAIHPWADPFPDCDMDEWEDDSRLVDDALAKVDAWRVRNA